MRPAARLHRHVSRLCSAIAALTAELCRAHYPEGLSVLVGGFVNLRYFSPAICVPWSYGLLARMPSDKARRNLVMLGKVLQSISNGFVNSKKEPYLLQVEELVKTYVPRMVDYLAALAFDPAAPPRASPGLAPSAIEPRTSRRRINVAARSSDEPTLAAPAAPSTWSPQRYVCRSSSCARTHRDCPDRNWRAKRARRCRAVRARAEARSRGPTCSRCRP